MFVNLEQRTCLCRRFDLDLVPCSHAIAAIRKAKHDVYAYCADYFKTKNVRLMYANNIYPVGHPDNWQVSIQIKSKIVLPPLSRVSSGQPLTNRFPSARERRRRPPKLQVCLIYHQPGHNRLNCSLHILKCHTTSSASDEFVEGLSRRPRRKTGVRRCSSCGQPGHTRLTCLLLKLFCTGTVDDGFMLSPLT
ncbi:hypothetical protein PTKIN_Ptkin07bG0256300 [Pterospermum kingtungense]